MYFLFVAFNNSCSFIFFQVILLDIYNDINAISLSITDNVLTHLRGNNAFIIIRYYNVAYLVPSQIIHNFMSIFVTIGHKSFSICTKHLLMKVIYESCFARGIGIIC